LRFETFADCGHGGYRDNPAVLDVTREFVEA